LRRAEQAPTTTDTDTLPRCPECGNPSGVRTKTAAVEQAHQIDTAYKCASDGCGHHFDEPAASINEKYGEQTTLNRRKWE
jgi:DNA-directed RNA polymerase subunit RPC12/RpoP